MADKVIIAMCVFMLLQGAGCADYIPSSLRHTADILPASATRKTTQHPLDAKIQQFLKEQACFHNFQATGATSRDYLKFIASVAEYFKQFQDSNGAIIDPVEKIEWQYSTPCYALAVGLLAATGYTRSADFIRSGIRAMQLSVDEMYENRPAQNHGEFFIQPIMLALDLYEKFVPSEQMNDWKTKIAAFDPYKLYPDNLRRKKQCYNHNVVALAGEYLRAMKGLNADQDFFECHLEHHKQYMNKLGMYQDNPGLPIVYDEFSRQFLASILVEGYAGKSSKFYKDMLWRGAWTSLFLQSPFGECPTGGRSSQHIWNEAQAVVTYEIYASQYACKGKLAEAGAFKRAAHLSFDCMRQWLRPDGSCYVVKNRYPMGARHGYERYSAHSQYNLLACWLLAVAYMYADDAIAEKFGPAEVGGFVLPIVKDFHKVFANAGGTYVEYDTSGHERYTPTGLIRIHIKGGNPQLGPSDGVVHRFDPKTKEDLGGENMAVGPAWQDSSGYWHRLADYNISPTRVEVLEETVNRVSFRVTYEGALEGATRVSQTIKVEPGAVTVEDNVQGVEAIRIYYPMLVFDGLEETSVKLHNSSAVLALNGRSIRFEVLQPSDAKLNRTGKRLENRNGLVEGLYADIEGTRAVYRISLPSVQSGD